MIEIKDGAWQLACFSRSKLSSQLFFLSYVSYRILCFDVCLTSLLGFVVWCSYSRHLILFNCSLLRWSVSTHLSYRSSRNNRTFWRVQTDSRKFCVLQRTKTTSNFCTSSNSLSQRKSTKRTRAENAFRKESISRFSNNIIFLQLVAIDMLILVRAAEFI